MVTIFYLHGNNNSYRITIFDDIQDDFYDGDFLEHDEDFPRVNLKFKMHLKPDSQKPMPREDGEDDQVQVGEFVEEAEEVKVNDEAERDENLRS